MNKDLERACPECGCKVCCPYYGEDDPECDDLEWCVYCGNIFDSLESLDEDDELKAEAEKDLWLEEEQI